MILRPNDLAYPSRLVRFKSAPALTTSGPLEHHRIAVAIVGSREPVPEAVRFTRKLAGLLADAGVLVVSGGALGIDAAAHEGALARGTTWCVAPNGRGRPYPPENAELFERIAKSPRSRMIWPFPDGLVKNDHTPKDRNRILVGLADVVVVVQAHFQSGSRNAITHARKLETPIFIVPAAPWMTAFVGSLWELSRDAYVLCHPSQLFRFLGLPWPEDGRPWPWPSRQVGITSHFENLEGPSEAPDQSRWTDEEKRVFSNLCTSTQHVDEVVAKTGLPTSATVTALLTLSLKDVVVEGPDGFFRRRKVP